MIALLYSQLSMVDVRARKSSVMEKRTGEQNNFKILKSKQSMFDRIEITDYLVFEVFGIRNFTQGTIS